MDNNNNEEFSPNEYKKRILTGRAIYYYLYYKLHKAWSKSDNILLSTNFRADISIITIKIWIFISIYAYSAIFFNIDTSKLNITSPELIISLIAVLGTTFRFLTFSKDWQPYFEEFEKWPKQKNLIGGIIVWSIIIFIFVNVFISVELMKKLR